MPIYSFCCQKCKSTYDELAPYDASGKYKKVACPHCKSKKKTQNITCSAWNFTNPTGSDKWCSDTSGHDYRFKYMQPKLKEQREKAEKKSHVGPSPYRNIDDISNGNFGEVK